MLIVVHAMPERGYDDYSHFEPLDSAKERYMRLTDRVKYLKNNSIYLFVRT